MPSEPLDFSADEQRAIEWALGLLDATQQREAERRRHADPAFRALCDSWEMRLATLADDLPSAELAPGLWTRIEAAIAPPAPASTTEAPAPRAGLWHSLALWRGASAAFAALALALLLTRPADPPAAAPPQAPPEAPAARSALLATTLAPEAGPPLVTVAVDPDRRALLLSPVAGPDGDGRVPELWVIPADGRPRSLGVIDLGGTRQIVVPPTLLELVADGATLAVSLEPVGGSPTGQPTGPVVATGTLARV